MRQRRLIIAVLLCAGLSLGAICQANERVTFVNPLEEPLYVQINEREPFEVPPGGDVVTSLPALGRLAPITITARDARGVAVYHRATSIIRIQTLGNKVVLSKTGQEVDPFPGSDPFADLLP